MSSSPLPLSFDAALHPTFLALWLPNESCHPLRFRRHLSSRIQLPLPSRLHRRPILHLRPTSKRQHGQWVVAALASGSPKRCCLQPTPQPRRLRKPCGAYPRSRVYVQISPSALGHLVFHSEHQSLQSRLSLQIPSHYKAMPLLSPASALSQTPRMMLLIRNHCLTQKNRVNSPGSARTQGPPRARARQLGLRHQLYETFSPDRPSVQRLDTPTPCHCAILKRRSLPSHRP